MTRDTHGSSIGNVKTISRVVYICKDMMRVQLHIFGITDYTGKVIFLFNPLCPSIMLSTPLSWRAIWFPMWTILPSQVVSPLRSTLFRAKLLCFKVEWLLESSIEHLTTVLTFLRRYVTPVAMVFFYIIMHSLKCSLS